MSNAMSDEEFEQLCRDLEPEPGSDPWGPYGTLDPAPDEVPQQSPIM